MSQGFNKSDHSDRNKDERKFLKVFNKKPSGSKEMDDVLVGESHMDQQSVKEKMVHSKIWKSIILICELILLFGFEIRDLFCPADSDVVFDVIFMLAFVLLIFDIILMSMTLPGYFNYGFSDQYHVRIIFGSWAFWLDFFSALTLLNEITFINRMRMHSEKYNILISTDDDGSIVANGIFRSNQRSVFSGLNLVANAVRMPRVARLMQAPGLLFILQWISQKLQRCCRLVLSKPVHEPITVDRNAKNEKQPSKRTSLRSSHVDPNIRSNSKFLHKKAMSQEKAHQMKKFLSKRSLEESRTNVTHSKVSPDTNYHPQFGLNRYAFDYTGGNLRGSNVSNKSLQRSQVGQTMFELTVRRVALALMITVALTAVCTPHQVNIYYPQSMIVLHESFTFAAENPEEQKRIFEYSFDENERNKFIYLTYGDEIIVEDNDGMMQDLRNREMTIVHVCNEDLDLKGVCASKESSTRGVLNTKGLECERAIFSIILLIFFMLLWYIGVMSFAGPIQALIIIPIEHMIKLLSMMVKDTLGYEDSEQYKRFVRNSIQEERQSNWNMMHLKGMETSFLMSTLLRIGSLLKVGFGEAGADIIRQSLPQNSSGNLDLSFKSRTIQSGVNVSCIFLFCDIRNYTDTTECLREEVFVFTNKIAEVVHSISHSFGGYANKNIGDAFLISWILEEENKARSVFARGESAVNAKSCQADKALLSVIKIILALNYESFFLSDLSEKTRKSLVERLSDNVGSIVKMGFGLHTGRAVQGVIGSERKLDATYISNVVEQVEYLESSTKRYGTKLLMSGEFYNLLQIENRRKCRLVDKVVFLTEETNTFETLEPENFEKMEIYTYDMDTNDLVERNGTKSLLRSKDDSSSNNIVDNQSIHGTSFLHDSSVHSNPQSETDPTHSLKTTRGRRLSVWAKSKEDEIAIRFDESKVENERTMLTLPSQPIVYKQSLWNTVEMKQIRKRFVGSNFFDTFSRGLEAYFSGRWKDARSHFEFTRDRFDDGPSIYFLKKMDETDNILPRGFKGWNEA